MVAEYIPTGGYSDSGAPPKWTGWYFDLFPDRHHSAERSPAFVADYFTLTNLGEVAYVGAERPRLAVFVVDVNGEPRAMVGPVAKGYELKGPIAARLNDETAREAKGKRAPWLSSYLAPDVEAPELHADSAECPGDGAGEARVVLRSARALGDVTVTLLDHHGDPITTSSTRPVGADATVFSFQLTPALSRTSRGVEGLHVVVHDLAASGQGRGKADLRYGVRVYTLYDAPLHHPFTGFFMIGEPSARPGMPGLAP
jgi:hypothetical protein